MTEELKFRADDGGSLQENWTDTASLLPVTEWASEIIGEGLAQMPYAGVVKSGGNLRRGNKKTHFLVSSVTTLTSLWATGVTSIRDNATYETPMDYSTLYIDPVEYRTMTPVAWETMDEIDMVNLKGDLQKNFAYLTGQKINHILYTAMDSTALDSAYDFQVAGNAIVYCDSNTAVDYDTGLSTDNVKSGIETLVGALYKPTDCILPPALYSDLFSESQFVNAAQYGSQNTAIIEGVIPRFMGVDFHLDQHMPDDNADKDVGFMIDKNYYMGMLVAKDGKMDYNNNYTSGEHEFYMTVKLGAKVLQDYAGVAFYS